MAKRRRHTDRVHGILTWAGDNRRRGFVGGSGLSGSADGFRSRDGRASPGSPGRVGCAARCCVSGCVSSILSRWSVVVDGRETKDGSN